MEMTSVKYAWFGTILLLVVILWLEGPRAWRAFRERRMRRISRIHAAAFLVLVATPAMAAGMVEWLHPEIIDRLERFIMTVGFSVFTALWFMFRAEKRLDKNNELQTEQIRLLKKLLGEQEDK